jgi:hypothetical protein
VGTSARQEGASTPAEYVKLRSAGAVGCANRPGLDGLWVGSATTTVPPVIGVDAVGPGRTPVGSITGSTRLTECPRSAYDS